MYDHDPRSRRAAVRPALAAISTPRLTAAPPFSVIPCALNGVSPATWMSRQSTWNSEAPNATRSAPHERRRPIS